jgi:hypothetical protein
VNMTGDPICAEEFPPRHASSTSPATTTAAFHKPPLSSMSKETPLGVPVTV